MKVRLEMREREIWGVCGGDDESCCGRGEGRMMEGVVY